MIYGEGYTFLFLPRHIFPPKVFQAQIMRKSSDSPKIASSQLFSVAGVLINQTTTPRGNMLIVNFTISYAGY